MTNSCNNICVKLRNLIAHSAFRIVAALLFAAALQARATEYWVATDGADTNPGTSDEPFASLTNALAVAQNGDTVKVRAGTYTIPSLPYTSSSAAQAYQFTTPAYNLTNAVSVIAVAGPGETMLAGVNNKWSHAFRIDNANAVVSGFTVKNVASPSAGKNNAQNVSAFMHVVNGLVTNYVIHTAGKISNAATPGTRAGITASGGQIVDCVVSNILKTTKLNCICGISVTGAATVRKCRVIGCTSNNSGCFVVSGANAVVSDCEVAGCSGKDPVSLTGAGAQLSNCVITNNAGSTSAVSVNNATATLRNCLVAGNSTSGETSVGGIYLSNGTVENCTVASNRNTNAGATCAGVSLAASADVVLRNVISWGNTLSDGSTGTAANFKDAGADEGAAAQGTVETCLYDPDPLFKNAANGDYSLASGSPARDAGTNQEWMKNAFDLAGNKRRAGRVDIGCYECQSASFCIIVR